MIDRVYLTQIALERAYRKGASNRSGRSLRVPESPPLVQKVAKELGDPRLAELFVEAQFEAMPSDWCRNTFNKPYPPKNAVFGGNCWVRYLGYLDDGIRTPL